VDSVGASLDGDVRSSSWWPSASHEHDRSKSPATEAGSPRLAPWRAEEVAHYGPMRLRLLVSASTSTVTPERGSLRRSV
jgi:hypothetical protein